MAIFKVSERILCNVQGAKDRKPFAGIIFDCDGVLIDASRSYDLTIEISVKAFGASLGVGLSGEEQLPRVIELLRNLGTFNNDWESVAVVVAYLLKKANVDPKKPQEDGSLEQKLKRLESCYLGLRSDEETTPRNSVGLGELISFLESCHTGQTREEIVSSLIHDKESRDLFSNFIMYPAPVGKGLLATFFDEVMYGKAVFRETYGLECATLVVSNPGKIENETTLVRADTLRELQRLCVGNLGLITGRPKVPTEYTLRHLFGEFFQRKEICVFTGENLLEADEVKPSPKPLFRVIKELQDTSSPLLYVGDSEEDLLMVERAYQTKLLQGQEVLFVAIAPTKERVEFFEKRGGVDCIVSSINELPKALLGEMTWAGTPA